MKKYILSFFVAACLPMTMWAQDESEEDPVFVEINETNFPDANFRAVVETFDTEVDENGNTDGKRRTPVSHKKKDNQNGKQDTHQSRLNYSAQRSFYLAAVIRNNIK